MQPFFSILVVCLNPGNKLKYTLESIKEQTFNDYEVIIKDGGSTDDSLKVAEGFEVVSKKDTGIYDAMNQAVALAKGKFVYFLNCGDKFYDKSVLDWMAEFIRIAEVDGETSHIFYGNIYERLTGQEVASNPQLDAFGCYRNVPCHQACFYEKELLCEHPFETRYRVRADYEQFLWCFFYKKTKLLYKKMLIVDYEGGGFSETKENRKASGIEHKEITRRYMTKGQLFKFKIIMLLTLAPLRRWIAQNEKTAGIYNRFKDLLYRSGT